MNSILDLRIKKKKMVFQQFDMNFQPTSSSRRPYNNVWNYVASLAWANVSNISLWKFLTSWSADLVLKWLEDSLLDK